jgi:hypothetical protein
MDDIEALRLTIQRCTAVLVLAVGLAIVGLATGDATVGYLLVGGSLFFFAVSDDTLGRRFEESNDSDAGVDQ